MYNFLLRLGVLNTKYKDIVFKMMKYSILDAAVLWPFFLIVRCLMFYENAILFFNFI